MAGLCWMAVMTAFFLSAENTLAVDQNRLALFVDDIIREYGTQGMFSLAVSIPDNQSQNINTILGNIFQSDPGNNVKNKINDGEVYSGTRVVAAKVLRHRTGGDDHAELRVVNKLDRFFRRSNRSDLLLFYVYASPCVDRCLSNTHEQRILRKIQKIKEWRNYAFVFTKIYEPHPAQTNRPTEAARRAALERLGSSIASENIFRCDRLRGHWQCTSCFNGRNVVNYCVSDPTSPSTSG